MLELVGLLLLIAVAFGWIFMAGVTEKKTGQKNLFVWPFLLVYWWGLGKPTVHNHETATTQTTHDNIKKLNETISLLIQKMEERERKTIKKTKKELKQNTNQGE